MKMLLVIIGLFILGCAMIAVDYFIDGIINKKEEENE